MGKISYKQYRKEALGRLVDSIHHADISKGRWRGREFSHVLPIDGKTRVAKRAAIKKYLGIDIVDNQIKEGLHTDAHHLNSSQLLCYRTFQLLLDYDRDKSVLITLLERFGIQAGHYEAHKFEYKDDLKWNNKSEGTSFDFYIKGREKEVFFEIKFTEYGFGQASNGESHKKKIEELYRREVEKCAILKKMEDDEIRRYYQFVRNIIRYKGDDTIIVFITDGNNPATNSAIDNFCNKFLNDPQKHVKFITWQDLNEKWPDGVEKPSQFACFG